nr:hypothetical protein [Tanacetum cinerariifolium]
SLRILFEQRIAAIKGYIGGSGGCVEMKGFEVMWRLFVVVVGCGILRDQRRSCGHFKDQEMDCGAFKKLLGEGGESFKCLDTM